MQYLFVATGTLLIFLIALIFSKKNRSVSDNILVIWLIVYLSNIITLSIVNSTTPPFRVLYGFIIEFSESSLFIHGPLLYFYTISLTRPEFRYHRKYLLHFILFAISYIYLLAGLFFPIGSNGSGRDILIVLKLIFIGCYLVYNILVLRRHSRNIEKIFSNTDTRTLLWLRFITAGLLLIWTIGVVSLLFFKLWHLQIPQYGGLYINLALCLFVFLLGYFGFRQVSIFSIINNEEKQTGEINGIEELLQEDPVEMKYKKSGLDTANAEKINYEMLRILRDQKVYLDQNLTLFRLAEMLDVQPNHLSQVINSFHKQSFFNFINAFRIEEVKDLLNSKKHKNLSLLGIAFECGFNSKASFNRAFKKQTGLTPTGFKKNPEILRFTQE